MLFTTPLFILVFFPLFFISYFFVRGKAKNWVAILSSIAFYAWGEPVFIAVVLVSIGVDWLLSKWIYKFGNAGKTTSAKIILTIAVTMNLSLLIYYKYTGFLLENINILFSKTAFSPIIWTQIALPIGVSFIVFEKITYLVDVYRRVGKPAINISSYAMYILLFPKLLAGPIVKYHDIEKQLYLRPETLQNISFGLFRFIMGLAKKVLIADPISKISDSIFALPVPTLDVSYAWIGLFCFTLQIYFDFSGYSDMAIGMAKMMGFDLNENFSMPYSAANFTDFWRRWHISLSTWIKSYLYVPLGGNRCGGVRTYFNLVLCFFLSGLWHGASWTYVVWGLYHGFFLAVDKLFWLRISERIPRLLNIMLTFFLVMIGWVFFRANSIGEAISYIFILLKINSSGFASVYINPSTKATIVFAALIIICQPFLPRDGVMMKCTMLFANPNWSCALTFIALIMLTLALLQIAAADFSPFIYFRF